MTLKVKMDTSCYDSARYVHYKIKLVLCCFFWTFSFTQNPETWTKKFK